MVSCTCKESNGIRCGPHGRTAPTFDPFPDRPALWAAVRRHWAAEVENCLTLVAYAIDGDAEWRKAAEAELARACCGTDSAILEAEGFRWWVGVNYGH